MSGLDGKSSRSQSQSGSFPDGGSSPRSGSRSRSSPSAALYPAALHPVLRPILHLRDNPSLHVFLQMPACPHRPLSGMPGAMHPSGLPAAGLEEQYFCPPAVAPAPCQARYAVHCASNQWLSASARPAQPRSIRLRQLSLETYGLCCILVDAPYTLSLVFPAILYCRGSCLFPGSLAAFPSP